MNINKVRRILADINSIKPLGLSVEVDKLERYDVKTQWFNKTNWRIPHGGENGIYIYSTTDDGEILYIGKGEYREKRGIGFRACAHLRKAEKKERMFPNHDWVHERKVSRERSKAIAAITAGDFAIWTLPIDPEWFSSLVEVFLLTACKKNDKRLPIFNERIG